MLVCVCSSRQFSFDELTEPHQINALRLSFAIVAVEYDWRKKAHTKQKKKLCRFHFTAEKNRADGKRTIVKSIWIIFFSQYVFLPILHGTRQYMCDVSIWCLLLSVFFVLFIYIMFFLFSLFFFHSSNQKEEHRSRILSYYF